MNKTLDDLTPSIREFCISNPEAAVAMVMDFVSSQIAPVEADAALCDQNYAPINEVIVLDLPVRSHKPSFAQAKPCEVGMAV